MVVYLWAICLSEPNDWKEKKQLRELIHVVLFVLFNEKWLLTLQNLLNGYKINRKIDVGEIKVNVNNYYLLQK